MEPVKVNLIDEFVTDLKEFPTLDQYGEIHRRTVEVQPQRIVSATTGTDTFTRGTIDIQWNVQGQSRYIPSLSYVKAEVELEVNGNAPTLQDDVALAESFMSNICNSASFYIGNKCISRCDDYVGQTSMLFHRTQRSYNWLNSVGKDAFYLIPDFKERQNLVSSNAEQTLFDFVTAAPSGLAIPGAVGYSNAANPTDIVFTGAVPKLTELVKIGDSIRVLDDANGYIWCGVTGVLDNVPGVSVPTIQIGNNLNVEITGTNLTANTITLRKDTNLENTNLNKKNIVQVLWQPPLGIFNNRSLVLGAGYYRLKITPKSDKVSALQTAPGKSLPVNATLNFRKFVMVNTIFQDSVFNDGDYYLVLDEFDVQNKRLNQASSLTSHNFTVPPTTHMISIFSQDGGAGSVDLPSVPPSLFRDANDSNVDLRHIQLFYGGKTSPVTLFDSSFTSDTNNLAQRYQWNAENTGLAEIGGETYQDWLTRGILYTTQFIKEQGNNSTELVVQLDFGNIENDVEMFVGCMYRNIVKVNIIDGFVSNVQMMEA